MAKAVLPALSPSPINTYWRSTATQDSLAAQDSLFPVGTAPRPDVRSLPSCVWAVGLGEGTEGKEETGNGEVERTRVREGVDRKVY